MSLGADDDAKKIYHDGGILLCAFQWERKGGVSSKMTSH